MAILGTLAELKEYFKGWHTKYYNELHEQYASPDHPNQKATKTGYGHVKLTNECKTYEDGLALSSDFGCNVNNRFNELQSEINTLKNDMISAEPIRMKIGRVRGSANGTLDELREYCNNGNSTFEMDMKNGNLGTWGASKIMFEPQWENINIQNFIEAPKDKLVVQLLDSTGEYIENKTVFINLNGVWYPRTTNQVGAVFIAIQFGADDVKSSLEKFHNGNPLTNDDRNLLRSFLINHCGKWRMMEVVSNSTFDINKINDNQRSRYEDTHNTISKKFLYVFGDNFWSYILGNPGPVLEEALDVPELDVDQYRYITNAYQKSEMLRRSAIKIDNVYGGKDTIGYKLFQIDSRGEKKYYRYPKTDYPNGYPENSSIDGGGF